MKRVSRDAGAAPCGGAVEGRAANNVKNRAIKNTARKEAAHGMGVWAGMGGGGYAEGEASELPA